ncbi:MAG: hypothetical protein VKJ64_18085 [Leptolyngbyaceae bacterium]|nr:hypothetical protein [Leptolyngbyaceae bacterium]
MVLSTPPQSTQPIVTWEALPPDFVLPDDPVENIHQPPLAAAVNCGRIPTFLGLPVAIAR